MSQPRRQNEYPARMRHYFSVVLPEDLRGATISTQAFMDVSIEFHPPDRFSVIIDHWGVILDTYWIDRPAWMITEILEGERHSIMLKCKTKAEERLRPREPYTEPSTPSDK